MEVGKQRIVPAKPLAEDHNLIGLHLRRITSCGIHFDRPHPLRQVLASDAVRLMDISDRGIIGDLFVGLGAIPGRVDEEGSGEPRTTGAYAAAGSTLAPSRASSKCSWYETGVFGGDLGHPRVA